jgi:hypothetical protein
VLFFFVPFVSLWLEPANHKDTKGREKNTKLRQYPLYTGGRLPTARFFKRHSGQARRIQGGSGPLGEARGVLAR